MSSTLRKHRAEPQALGLAERAEEASRTIADAAAYHDEHDEFVGDNYAALQRLGLVEAGVPVDLGGGGANVIELADMLRILAHGCSSTALAFAMHTHQVAVPAWRRHHQKVTAVEPLLKRVASEKIILLSSGGSDWIAGSGKAEKVDGGYHITARKVFSSGAPIGSLLMTSAVTDSDDGGEVLHFGIPMTSPNVHIDPVWKALGMRGTGSHDIVIDGHFVPEAAVAARRKPGEWHPLFQIIATVAFPLIYSVYLGVAESARDIAIDLARKRRADSSNTQLAGRMDTALHAARLAHRNMVDVASRGHADAQTVNEAMMSKDIVTEHVLAVAAMALELAGGAGFYRSAGLERRFRDVQGARYHPMRPSQQAAYSGSLAMGQPVNRIF